MSHNTGQATMHRRFLGAINGSNHESDKSSSSNSTSSPSSASDKSEAQFHPDQDTLEVPQADLINREASCVDNAELAAIIARYGHAPSTAWLERTRYHIWRPSDLVLPSSFLPVQGYLHTKDWVFAWGCPLVSDEAALAPTVSRFVEWVKAHKLRLVYFCVPSEVEALLGDMGWSTVGCVSEDVIDPEHILALTQADDEGGHGSKIKDLKKNLRRAERANVEVKHIPRRDWSYDLKHEIEDGIAAWKRARNGYQLAATFFDPWLDFENREYWIALQHGRVIGILILTPARNSYVIKNAAQFPYAPKGTSELLIHTVLRDVLEHPNGVDDDTGHPMVSFNISASSDLDPYRNISKWKIEWLNQLYKRTISMAHLVNRHDFRRKFDTFSRQMFVCYPSEDGFGMDGIEDLLKLLRC